MEKNLYTAMDEHEQLVLSVLFAGVLAISPGGEPAGRRGSSTLPWMKMNSS
jgi:hypothetical protein